MQYSFLPNVIMYLYNKLLYRIFVSCYIDFSFLFCRFKLSWWQLLGNIVILLFGQISPWWLRGSTLMISLWKRLCPKRRSSLSMGFSLSWLPSSTLECPSLQCVLHHLQTNIVTVGMMNMEPWLLVTVNSALTSGFTCHALSLGYLQRPKSGFALNARG